MKAMILRYFFLCRFLRKRFFRLCVDILCLFLFFPLGIMFTIKSNYCNPDTQITYPLLR